MSSLEGRPLEVGHKGLALSSLEYLLQVNTKMLRTVPPYDEPQGCTGQQFNSTLTIKSDSQQIGSEKVDNNDIFESNQDQPRSFWISIHDSSLSVGFCQQVFKKM